MQDESYDFVDTIQLNVTEHLRRLRREQGKIDDSRKVAKLQVSDTLLAVWMRRFEESLVSFSRLYSVELHKTPVQDEDLGGFIRTHTKNVRTHSLLFVSLRDTERLALHMIHGQRYTKLGTFELKTFGSELVWEEEVRGIKKLVLDGRTSLRR